MQEDRTLGPASDANQNTDPNTETLAGSHSVYHTFATKADLMNAIVGAVASAYDRQVYDDLESLQAEAAKELGRDVAEWLSGALDAILAVFEAHGSEDGLRILKERIRRWKWDRFALETCEFICEAYDQGRTDKVARLRERLQAELEAASTKRLMHVIDSIAEWIEDRGTTAVRHRMATLVASGQLWGEPAQELEELAEHLVELLDRSDPAENLPLD